MILQKYYPQLLLYLHQNFLTFYIYLSLFCDLYTYLYIFIQNVFSYHHTFFDDRNLIYLVRLIHWQNIFENRSCSLYFMVIIMEIHRHMDMVEKDMDILQSHLFSKILSKLLQIHVDQKEDKVFQGMTSHHHDLYLLIRQIYFQITIFINLYLILIINFGYL